jgi:type IV secretion system protein VirB8
MNQPLLANNEDAFYQQGMDWEAEIQFENTRQLQIAYIISVVASVIALLAVTAIFFIMPLKTTETYVVTVDKTTGMVDIKLPLTEQSIPQDEAITKYFLGQYVTAREGYMRSRAAKDYNLVSKLSSPIVYQTYHDKFKPENPRSPLNRYRDKTIVEVDVTSISFLSENTAYITIERSEIFPDQQKTHYEAVTIDFHYVLTPLKEKDRLINPLGFEVTDYRVDPQVLTNNLKS